MKTIFLNILVMLTITIVSGMAGCGGGGSSSSSPNPGTTPTASQTVSGVAATGAPISGTIYLKDSSNPAVVKNTTTNADGSFSFDVTGLTAPFMLKAVGTSSGQNYTLYSVAGAPGVANINPLSHLAVVKANGGVDPAALYNNLTREQAQAIKTALETVIPQIQAMLLQVLSQYGVTTTHFIKDAYTANHMGLDLLLDMIDIVVNNGILTMTNKVSGATILTTTLTGNTLNGQVVTANIPTVPTQTAGTVYVYPASATLSTSGTAKFKSFVIGSMNQSVTWSVVETGGGSITSAGVYTAPATAGTYHVKATNVADATISTLATVMVTATVSAPASIMSKVSEIIIPNATIRAISYFDSFKHLVVSTDNNMYVVDASNLNSLVLNNTVAKTNSSAGYLVPDSTGVFFSSGGADNYLDLTSMALSTKTFPGISNNFFYNGDSGKLLGVYNDDSLTLSTGRTVSMSKSSNYFYLELYNGSSLLASVGNNDWWYYSNFKAYDIGNGNVLIAYPNTETVYVYSTTGDKLTLVGKFRVYENFWDLKPSFIYNYQNYLFIGGNGYMFSNDAKVVVYKLNL